MPWLVVFTLVRTGVHRKRVSLGYFSFLVDYWYSLLLGVCLFLYKFTIFFCWNLGCTKEEIAPEHVWQILASTFERFVPSMILKTTYFILFACHITANFSLLHWGYLQKYSQWKKLRYLSATKFDPLIWSHLQYTSLQFDELSLNKQTSPIHITSKIPYSGLLKRELWW